MLINRVSEKYISNTESSMKEDKHEYSQLSANESPQSFIIPADKRNYKQKLLLKDSQYNLNEDNVVINVRKESSNSNTILASEEEVETDMEKVDPESITCYKIKTEINRIPILNLDSNNKKEINLGSISNKINVISGISTHRNTPSINSKNLLIGNNNIQGNYSNAPDEESSNGGYTDRILVGMSNKHMNNINKKSKSTNTNSNNAVNLSFLISDLFNQITSTSPPTLSLENIHLFLTNPIPQGKTLRCNILRKKKGEIKSSNKSTDTADKPHNSDKNYPKYFVSIAENDKILMAACCYNKERSILLTSSYEVFDKQNKFYLGRVKSNFFGTEFNFYDTGKKANETKSYEDIRSNLGTAGFEVSFFGLRKPRKVEVYLPSVEENNRGKEIFKVDSLRKIYGTNSNKITKFINKQPEWSEKKKAYVLNFNGRVKIGSKKNFQLIEEGEENKDRIILQFGKRGKNKYSMDFTFPLTPQQAFSICLSTLYGKLASE